MKQCILIVTHRENFKLFSNCLKSVRKYNKSNYQVIIVVNDAKNTTKEEKEKYRGMTQKEDILIFNEKDGFELGALKRVLEETDYEEIFLMQDSCEIKDSILFDMVFRTEGSVAISFGYLSYLGKYERSVLRRLEIPNTYTKTESVRQEGQFNANYLKKVEKYIVLFRSFGFTGYEGNRKEVAFGRKNLISENNYLIKYKATYSADMIKD